jgi:nitrile hydratase subunit beta
MNGAHDLGGQMGFGSVVPEPNEPVFHADWEKRALALTLAMGATGQWNIDMSRAMRESLPPAQYLANNYYEIWLAGLQRLMVQQGLVQDHEWPAEPNPTPLLTQLHQPTFASQTVGMPVGAKPPNKVSALLPYQVDALLKRGSPTERPTDTSPQFVLGQKVKTINDHPQGHTRLPRYARDKVGTVVAIRGFHVFADASAQGLQQAQWLYSIGFAGSTLWGSSTTADEVVLDCWQSYLLPIAS